MAHPQAGEAGILVPTNPLRMRACFNPTKYNILEEDLGSSGQQGDTEESNELCRLRGRSRISLFWGRLSKVNIDATKLARERRRCQLERVALLEELRPPIMPGYILEERRIAGNKEYMCFLRQQQSNMEPLPLCVNIWCPGGCEGTDRNSNNDPFSKGQHRLNLPLSRTLDEELYSTASSSRHMQSDSSENGGYQLSGAIIAPNSEFSPGTTALGRNRRPRADSPSNQSATAIHIMKNSFEEHDLSVKPVFLPRELCHNSVLHSDLYQCENGCNSNDVLRCGCTYCKSSEEATLHVSSVRLMTPQKKFIYGLYYKTAGAKQTLFFSHGCGTDIGYLRHSCVLLCLNLHVNLFVYDYEGYGCTVAGSVRDKRHYAVLFRSLSRRGRQRGSFTVQHQQQRGRVPEFETSISADTAEERSSSKIQQLHCNFTATDAAERCTETNLSYCNLAAAEDLSKKQHPGKVAAEAWASRTSRRVRWHGRNIGTDAKVAYQWLLNEQQLNPNDIFLVGHSLGAAAVLRLLHMLSHEEKKAIKELKRRRRRRTLRGLKGWMRKNRSAQPGDAIHTEARCSTMPEQAGEKFNSAERNEHQCDSLNSCAQKPQSWRLRRMIVSTKKNRLFSKQKSTAGPKRYRFLAFLRNRRSKKGACAQQQQQEFTANSSMETAAEAGRRGSINVAAAAAAGNAPQLLEDAHMKRKHPSVELSRKRGREMLLLNGSRVAGAILISAAFSIPERNTSNKNTAIDKSTTGTQCQLCAYRKSPRFAGSLWRRRRKNCEQSCTSRHNNSTSSNCCCSELGFAYHPRLRRRLRWVTAAFIEKKFKRLSCAPLLLLEPPLPTTAQAPDALQENADAVATTDSSVPARISTHLPDSQITIIYSCMREFLQEVAALRDSAKRKEESAEEDAFIEKEVTAVKSWLKGKSRRGRGRCWRALLLKKRQQKQLSESESQVRRRRWLGIERKPILFAQERRLEEASNRRSSTWSTGGEMPLKNRGNATSFFRRRVSNGSFWAADDVETAVDENSEAEMQDRDEGFAPVTEKDTQSKATSSKSKRASLNLQPHMNEKKRLSHEKHGVEDRKKRKLFKWNVLPLGTTVKSISSARREERTSKPSAKSKCTSWRRFKAISASAEEEEEDQDIGTQANYNSDFCTREGGCSCIGVNKQRGNKSNSSSKCRAAATDCETYGLRTPALVNCREVLPCLENLNFFAQEHSREVFASTTDGVASDDNAFFPPESSSMRSPTVVVQQQDPGLATASTKDSSCNQGDVENSVERRGSMLECKGSSPPVSDEQQEHDEKSVKASNTSVPEGVQHGLRIPDRLTTSAVSSGGRESAPPQGQQTQQLQSFNLPAGARSAMSCYKPSKCESDEGNNSCFNCSSSWSTQCSCGGRSGMPGSPCSVCKRQFNQKDEEVKNNYSPPSRWLRFPRNSQAQQKQRQRELVNERNVAAAQSPTSSRGAFRKLFFVSRIKQAQALEGGCAAV